MGNNVSGQPVTSIFNTGDMSDVFISLIPVFFKLLFSHPTVTIHNMYTYHYHNT